MARWYIRTTCRCVFVLAAKYGIVCTIHTACRYLVKSVSGVGGSEGALPRPPLPFPYVASLPLPVHLIPSSTPATATDNGSGRGLLRRRVRRRADQTGS